MLKPLDEADRWRLLLFATTAFTAASIRIAAWRYAAWYDPWLTPRRTHYMIIWSQIGSQFFSINALLIFVGIVLLAQHSSLRQRLLTWLALAALVASIGIPGSP
jgi:hypothetical protein